MMKLAASALPQQIHSASRSRFGCRLFAYISERPDTSQAKLLEDCLVKNPMSLAKRSLLPPAQAQKISIGGWVGIPNHTQGWGIAAYGPDSQNPFKIGKNWKTAGSDPLYPKAVKGFARFHPRILLAHIRSGSKPIVENNHPFVHNEWTMMHNGFVDGAFKPDIQAKVQQYFPKAVKGTTDTEQMFYYFLAKLKGTGKSTNTFTPEGVQNVLSTFTRAVLDIKDRSTPQNLDTTSYFEKRTGIPMVQGGQISTGQAANVVASNGHMLMATKTGRSLYLGTRTNSQGGKEVMLSSEEMQTKLPKGNITWWEIPDDHMVAVWPNAKQRLQVLLAPFDTYEDTLAAITPKA